MFRVFFMRFCHAPSVGWLFLTEPGRSKVSQSRVLSRLDPRILSCPDICRHVLYEVSYLYLSSGVSGWILPSVS